MRRRTVLAFHTALTVFACASYTVAGEARFEPAKDISLTARPVLPLNLDSPEIILRYCYEGTTKQLEWGVPVPGADPFLKQFSIRIDGVKPRRTILAAEKSYGYAVSRPLRRGEPYEYRMNLAKAYRIPKGWRRIEISPYGGMA